MYRVLVSLVCSLLLSLTVGCSSWLPNVYRVDIRQGNYINRSLAAQLKPGMNKNQVQLLLGSPLLTDPFHANRWDYVYTLQEGHGPMEERRLTLFFEGDVLKRIEGADTLPL